jgi:hypothetical protein
MNHTAKFVLGGILLMSSALMTACVAPPPRAQAHPAYLHALSDLRAARWLVEHRPGDWAQTNDEAEAVRQIDAAINDIKQAAIDDGKNLNDRPRSDAHFDNRGRIHEALRLLRKARADVAREEDNAYAHGLRNRAVGHIDAAIAAARSVFHE